VKFDIFYQLPEAANQITTERYRELIAEAAEADRLGFNTVWLAEVHFAPRFSVMPTPLLLLAAIAERTTNIRLGMAVNLMPLHHPIRLAEEVATLDVLSGGRVEFGAGRGAFPLNYRGYGVDMADSRKLFEDGSLAAGAQAEFQKVRDRLRAIDYSTVDSIMGIFGDPEYCIDRIAQLKEQFGFSRLVCWFEIGGISGHQNVLAAMRLFADRVMPKFQ
jgi:hypothetical protein